MKFEDEVRRYCNAKAGPQWTIASQSKELWNNEADLFVAWSVQASVPSDYL